jgi:3-oxoacid CoA-transferase B subunit
VERPSVREAIAAEVAGALDDGTFVNVGIGIPGLVPHHTPDERGVVFHAEHGVVGFGSDRFGPQDGPVLAFFGTTYRMRPGGFICDHARSFALVRAGLLDATILGAFEVEASGRFANYRTGEMASGCPGGSPELAGAARRVILAMEHRDRRGRPRLVAASALPIALPRAADLVVTELGRFVPEGDAFRAERLAPGVSEDDVRAATDAEVRFP